jgi:hypothetical protein
MINNSKISTKRKITSHLNSLDINKSMTYDVGSPQHGLGQTQQYGGVKPVSMIPPLVIAGPLTAMH